jgi:hypothetical protein
VGVVIIKGAKTLVDCNENLNLHYFEKQLFIKINEIIIHILELWLFTQEVIYYVINFFNTQNICL